MNRLFALLFLLPALFLAYDVSAKNATAEDATAMVEKGIKLIKAKGQSAAFAAFNDKSNTEFHQGELYLFVYDSNGTCLSHGNNPKQIGKNGINSMDPNGKYFVKEIIATVKTKGKGWVDYFFKNPVSRKIEPMSTYVAKVDGQDVIVCCGISNKHFG